MSEALPQEALLASETCSRSTIETLRGSGWPRNGKLWLSAVSTCSGVLGHAQHHLPVFTFHLAGDQLHRYGFFIRVSKAQRGRGESCRYSLMEELHGADPLAVWKKIG